MKISISLFLLMLSCFCDALSIAPQQAELLAQKIWKNECAGTLAGLTTWNQGEEFASLGIGHFIWYPEGVPKRFQETFPELLSFLGKKDVACPSWLQNAKACPWKSREEFYREIDSPRMVALRQFLFETKRWQAFFIAERLEKSLPYMVQSLDETERQKVSDIFHRLASDPKGLYALIDYINFKGEGTSPQEAYRGHRWGLLQVLQRLSLSDPNLVAAFVTIAKQLLQERVDNAPAERHEERWLKGWFNRLDTYSD